MSEHFRFRDIPHDKHFLSFDSSQRNPVRFPNPNDYVETLFNEIKNVLYVKLLDCQIPVSDFNVNEFNNGFVLTDNGVDYPVTLPPGDYDSNKLITELTSAVTALVGPTNVYTFSIVNGMLRVQGTGGVLPFTLKFAPPAQFADQIVSASGGTEQEVILNQSARTVMGFTIADFTSVGGPIGEILSPNKISLVKDKVVYIYLSSSDKDSLPMVESKSQGARDTFYRIPLSSPRNTYTFFKNDYNFSYVPNPPLRRVRSFRIQLRTENGRELYNTRGLDWCMSLEVASSL